MFEQKKNDMRKEEAINRLLLNTFFKPYLNSSDIVTEIQRQFHGIDITVPRLGNVDLKSAFTRLDGTLKTFAIELMYRTNGKTQQGWFLKDSKTHYYSFNYFRHRLLYEKSWKDYTNEEMQQLRVMNGLDDIGQSEIILVNKYILKNFLMPYYNDESKQLITNMVHQNITMKRIDDLVSVFYSVRLREKPINFLVAKPKLIELADIHARIDHQTNIVKILKDNIFSDKPKTIELFTPI